MQPEKTPLPLSIVVPTKDRKSLLEGCLDSLSGALRSWDELIVVDSASESPVIREIALAKGARYIRCDVAGTSRARNAGWRAAKNEIVAFVDDDVRVDRGWADAYSRTFEEFPEAWFACGSTGKPEVGDVLQALAQEEHPYPEHIDATTHDYGHTANLAVRKEALETIGGFDEQMGGGAPFAAGEDKDLLDRLFRVGATGRYEPSARAVHLPWRTMSDLIRVNWNYGIGAGARLAKLKKERDPRFRMTLRGSLWSWGIFIFLDELRRLHLFLALMAPLRIAGMVVGFARLLPRKLRAGHISPRE